MAIQSYASARTLYYDVWTICSVLCLSKKYSELTLEVIVHEYFSSHNKLKNDLLVRDFVKLHYHHDAKVIDSKFIRRNK